MTNKILPPDSIGAAFDKAAEELNGRRCYRYRLYRAEKATGRVLVIEIQAEMIADLVRWWAQADRHGTWKGKEPFTYHTPLYECSANEFSEFVGGPVECWKLQIERMAQQLWKAAVEDPASGPPLDIAALVADRDRALVDLDLGWVRKMLPNLPDDEAGLAALHKARYEVPTMPDELRHASREWLESRGMKRGVDAPWPPQGVLPTADGSVP